MCKQTLDFYNSNAKLFYDNTVAANFCTIQNKFLSYLKPGNQILDFGCGSGRDTKYFLEYGMTVEAVDGSKEICKLASYYTGIEVKQKKFEELNETDKYYAVWACASILHLPYEELKCVMKKIANALKPGGILYTSFKYGEFEGERGGRYFTDMNEMSMNGLLSEIKLFTLEEMWVSTDVRPERDDEKWLNIILRENCQNQRL